VTAANYLKYLLISYFLADVQIVDSKGHASEDENEDIDDNFVDTGKKLCLQM